MKYQIIYLNGPSSVGKTSLAKALQEVLEPPFLHIGIDRMIEMMPLKVNDWNGGTAPEGFSWEAGVDEQGKVTQKLLSGPFAQKITRSYLEVVELLASRSHSLIVDDVSVTEAEFNRWKTLLARYSVLYVGLKASLEVLEKREAQRGDRMLGSARLFFQEMKFGKHYDLELDTSHRSVRECVQIILEKAV